MVHRPINKLLILDRDGVINHDSDDYIKNIDEWHPIDGSIESIAKLSKAGFIITVATNQSGIGRGIFDLDNLEQIHNRLCELVELAGGVIAGIFYCPHGPDDVCGCRKPKAGLIDAIESDLNISAAGSFLVGDSLRDLQAAQRKSCIPVLVRTGKGLVTEKKIAVDHASEFTGLTIFDDLQSFADWLMTQ